MLLWSSLNCSFVIPCSVFWSILFPIPSSCPLYFFSLGRCQFNKSGVWFSPCRRGDWHSLKFKSMGETPMCVCVCVCLAPYGNKESFSLIIDSCCCEVKRGTESRIRQKMWGRWRKQAGKRGWIASVGNPCEQLRYIDLLSWLCKMLVCVRAWVYHNCYTTRGLESFVL